MNPNYINNAISVSGANSTPWQNATGTKLFIQNNLINRVYRGISLNGMNGYPSLISNNTVSLTVDGLYGATQQGINVVNTQSAVVVTTNTVLGAGTTSTLGNLIYVGSNNGTNSPSVTCNLLSNAYQGFVFDNNNTGTVWFTNKLNAPLIRGMVLKNAGVIGTQGGYTNTMNNEWNGTWTSGINYGTWTADLSTYASSSPLFAISASPYNPPNNDGSPTPQSYLSGGLFYGTGSASCGGGSGGMMAPASFGSTIASAPSVVNSTAQSSEVNYMANTANYRSYNNNSTVQSNFVNSSIDKFMQVENANYKGNTALANTLNAVITCTNAIEQNYKNYNALYHKFATANFTIADSSSLINLAKLCAGQNGACIYQARALYNSIYKTVLTVKDNCTYGVNLNSRLLNNTTKTETIANSWTVDLFPNPTSNEVNLVSIADSENLQVTVRDVSGKIYVSKNYVTSNFICKLDLDLVSGMYLVTITNANKNVSTKKLIIAK